MTVIDEVHRQAAVPSCVFTVDDVPARERYEVWKESISCIFDVDADRETRSEDFGATVDACLFGPVMVARSTSRGQLWERSARTIARDGMDHYMIQLYENGGQALTAGTAEIEQPEAGLLVYDLTRTVTARTGSFTNLSLILPRQMLADALTGPDDQHMRVLSADLPMVALLREHMISMKALAPQMSPTQADAVLPATVALTAACLNHTGAEGTVGDPGVVQATMTSARRLIDANLASPHLTPGWLATKLGMSRAKLYRYFEPVGGVAASIREHRLRRALALLRSARHRHFTIYQIALEVGFGDQASFARAFRQRFEVSPREIRRDPDLEGQARLDLEGPDRRYEDWLHHRIV